MKLQFRITNNFNNEVFETTSTGQDLRNEIRQEAINNNKSVSDFIINKIN